MGFLTEVLGGKSTPAEDFLPYDPEGEEHGNPLLGVEEEEGGGLSGCFQKLFKQKEPRELTVEEKNMYLRKVYFIVGLQMFNALILSLFVKINDDCRHFFNSFAGKIVTSLNGLALLLLQLLMKCKPDSAKSRLGTLLHLTGFTACQGIGMSGLYALDEESVTGKVVFLGTLFTVLGMMANTAFGFQLETPHNSVAGYSMQGALAVLSGVLTKFSPLNDFLHYCDWKVIAATMASVFILGSYSLYAGERIITYGDIDPFNGQPGHGALCLYSEFVTMGLQGGPGGFSTVKKVFTSCLYCFRKHRDEREAQEETELMATHTA